MPESPIQTLQSVLDANLRTVQRIWKELDESNGDYEGVWSDHKLWRYYASIHLPTGPQSQHRSLYQVP